MSNELRKHSRFGKIIRGLPWILIGSYFAISLVIEVRGIWTLATDGIQTIGVIKAYKPETCGRVKRHRTCHYHIVEYSGNTKKFDLGKEVDEGTKLNLVYLPFDPSIARLGRLYDLPADYMLAELNIYDYLFLIITLVFYWCGGEWFLEAIKPNKKTET